MENKTDGNPNEANDKRSPLYESTRRIMLAAIGVAAVAQEELDAFLTRMAERGELAEKDARKLVDEMKTRREELAAEMKAKREQLMEERQQRRNAATRADVEALNARVAELTAQLEELKRTQAGGKINGQ